MKIVIMKTNTFTIRILPILAVAVILGFDAKPDTVTLSLTNPGSASFNVPSNVVAQVIHAYAYSANFQIGVTIKGVATTYQCSTVGNTVPNVNLPIVTGPAIISLTNGGTSLIYCTIQTSPAVSTPINFIPSTAVVIPDDGGGPVTIILESSTDLVSWTPALPDTYGTTSSNRFFRVRAQR